jgi:hypothetical protein
MGRMLSRAFCKARTTWPEQITYYAMQLTSTGITVRRIQALVLEIMEGSIAV